MPSKESLTANITACFESLEEALEEQGDAARIAGEAMSVIPTTGRYDVVAEWGNIPSCPVDNPIWGRTLSGDWELGSKEEPKKEPEINITISEKLNLIEVEDVESG